jgi:hypothetical protein
MELHKQLFYKDKKYIMNYEPSALDSLLKRYKYLDGLDEKIRNDFRRDLMKDINTIEVNYLKREDMAMASAELKAQQVTKIAEVNKLIETQCSILMNVYKQNIDKLKVRYEKSPDEVTTKPRDTSKSNSRSPTSGMRFTVGRMSTTSPVTKSLSTSKKASISSTTDLARDLTPTKSLRLEVTPVKDRTLQAKVPPLIS